MWPIMRLTDRCQFKEEFNRFLNFENHLGWYLQLTGSFNYSKSGIQQVYVESSLPAKDSKIFMDGLMLMVVGQWQELSVFVRERGTECCPQCSTHQTTQWPSFSHSDVLGLSFNSALCTTFQTFHMKISSSWDLNKFWFDSLILWFTEVKL